MSSQGRHRVVIVGGGFGGVRATRALARTDVDITIVDRTNHHLFQPLLYQVATGILPDGLSPRHAQRGPEAGQRRVGWPTCSTWTWTAGSCMPWPRDGQKLMLRDDSLVVAAGCTDAYSGHDEWAGSRPAWRR